MVAFLITVSVFWKAFASLTAALAAVLGGLGTLIWFLGPRDTTQASTRESSGTDLFRPGL